MTIKDDYLPEELRTLYAWTFEEAQRAQKEWDKTEHDQRAKGPIFRWDAVQKLKELADHFKETDDKNIILEAVFLCAMNGLPMPGWCSMAYVEAYRDVWFRAVTSWDEAFGKPHPKGTHAFDHRTERNNSFKIYQRIQEISKEEGSHVDGNLFLRVGLEMGIGGKTKTAELYYAAKKWFDSINEMRSEATNEMMRKMYSEPE